MDFPVPGCLLKLSYYVSCEFSVWYNRYRIVLFDGCLERYRGNLDYNVVPALNYRTAIITQLISMVMILYICRDFAETISWNKQRICSIGVVYVALLTCYMVNALQTGRGYYYNSRLNRTNQQILSDAEEAVEAGEQITTLTLYKMHDDRYAEDMPYQKAYIAYWMKEYYVLPQTVEFVYEDAWKYQE